MYSLPLVGVGYHLRDYNDSYDSFPFYLGLTIEKKLIERTCLPVVNSNCYGDGTSGGVLILIAHK